MKISLEMHLLNTDIGLRLTVDKKMIEKEAIEQVEKRHLLDRVQQPG